MDGGAEGDLRHGSLRLDTAVNCETVVNVP